jgi:hypothetical protein
LGHKGAKGHFKEAHHSDFMKGLWLERHLKELKGLIEEISDRWQNPRKPIR